MKRIKTNVETSVQAIQKPKLTKLKSNPRTKLVKKNIDTKIVAKKGFTL
jgi:hypothetical protein